MGLIEFQNMKIIMVPFLLYFQNIVSKFWARGPWLDCITCPHSLFWQAKLTALLLTWASQTVSQICCSLIGETIPQSSISPLWPWWPYEHTVVTYNSPVTFLLHQVWGDLGQKMTNDTPSSSSDRQMDQTLHQKTMEIWIRHLKFLSLTSYKILQKPL